MSARQNPISEQSIAPTYEFAGVGLIQRTVIPFLGAGASLGRMDSHAEWTPNSDFLPRTRESATYLKRGSSFPIIEAADLPDVAQRIQTCSPQQRASRNLLKVYAPSNTCLGGGVARRTSWL